MGRSGQELLNPMFAAVVRGAQLLRLTKLIAERIRSHSPPAASKVDDLDDELDTPGPLGRRGCKVTHTQVMRQVATSFRW